MYKTNTKLNDSFSFCGFHANHLKIYDITFINFSVKAYLPDTNLLYTINATTN